MSDDTIWMLLRFAGLALLISVAMTLFSGLMAIWEWWRR